MIFPKIPLLVMLALQYLNVPYRWAGNDFNAMDCSGLIVRILKDASLIKKTEDYTAQGLYKLLSNHSKAVQVGGLFSGSLLFFGKSSKEITHIGICISPNSKLMIHAGGGDSTTKTLKDAVKRDARVKISPIRSDLVGTVYLDV